MLEEYTITYWLDKDNNGIWDFVVIKHNRIILVNLVENYDSSYIKIKIKSNEIEIIGDVNSFKIDDLRIYATALSEEDIKELYLTRVQLDEHGNLYIAKAKQKFNYLDGNVYSRYSKRVDKNPNFQTMDGRNVWNVEPSWFHLAPTLPLSDILKPNKQYKISIEIKHDTVHLDVYRPGGFRIYYTDGSFMDMICPGGTGWNKIERLTNKDKSVAYVSVYYYTSFPVYINTNSYMVEI